MKVLVIGIDGATFDVILPMIQKGKLSNISKILKNGVYGNLHSVFPPVTFPAWTSFKTGKNPGKHGVFDFLRGIPYTSEDNSGISIGDVKDKSFWKLLSENGYKVGVVNVPTTYPPEKINGIFISGFGTPTIENEFVYPKELRNEIIQKFDYELDIIEHRIPGKEDEFIKKLTVATNKLTDVTDYVLEKNDFDFFMFNFMAVDQCQHFFFGYKDKNHPLYTPEKAKYGEYIDYFYSLIDKNIGRILKHVDENTNIIIVSDHGFGPTLKIVYMNEWLKQEGYLTLKKEKDSISSIFSKPREIAANLIYKINPSITNKLPRALKDKANDYISWTKDVDWSKTKAYSGGYPGKIYINLKGREKEGIISKGAEYDNLVKELITKLKEWKDPTTGEKIVTDIYLKEQIYSKGKYYNIAPDLISILRNMAYLARPGFKNGKLFHEPWQGGDHRLNGIFIASGPDIKNTGSELKNLFIFDIAPTILHIYETPILDDMDGKVLKEIFKESSIFSDKEIKINKIDREKELVREKIKNLKLKGKI